MSTFLLRHRLVNRAGLPLRFAWFLALLTAASTLTAETLVNRPDNPNSVRGVTLGTTQWTLAGSPYVIEAQVNIAEGATLSIASGVQVLVTPGNAIFADGTLQADGTIFNVRGTGNWRGIYFGPNSTNSALDKCTIQSAGQENLGYFRGGWRRTALYVDSANVRIANSTISDCVGHGIELFNSSAVIQGNTFLRLPADWYTIVLDTLDVFPTLAANINSSAGTRGVYLPSGEIKGTHTWTYGGQGMFYVPGDDITLTEGSTLTINPGVEVRSSTAAFWFKGTLLAKATATQPITFTSLRAPQASGDWRGLYFGPGSTNSSLQYVQIAFAGRENLGYIRGGWRAAALFLDATSPLLDHLTLTDSFWNGIEMMGCQSRITNARIERCGGRGLIARDGSRPTLTDTAFVQCGTRGDGSYALYLEPNSIPDPTRVSFTGNPRSAIEVSAGSITTNTLWKNWAANAPYVLTGEVTVDATVKLQIEPGTNVKGHPGAALMVQGTLTANGTPDAITFTSWRDDAAGGDSNADSNTTVAEAGNWRGIYLSPASGDSILRNVTLRYAGQENLAYIRGGWRRTALYLDACDARVEQSRILDSNGHGIEVWSARPVIQGNLFQRLPAEWYAVVIDTLEAFPSFASNTNASTGTRGVYLPGGEVSGTNTWNQPGPNMFYVAGDDITLTEGSRLTIDPGVEFWSANRAFWFKGTLVANGTTDRPILFKSLKSPSGPGDWRGLYFGPLSGKSSLKNVTLSNAGAENLGYLLGAWRSTSLFTDNSSPTFDNLIIQSSYWNGFEIHGAAPTFTNTRVEDSGGFGIIAVESATPNLTNIVLRRNGARGTGNHTVLLDGNSCPLQSGITFEGNSFSGVQVDGGTLDHSVTWKPWAPNAPYAISRDISIATNTTLTLSPATTLKFYNTALFFEGTLNAVGTSNQPITFTSIHDDSVGGDANGNGTTTTPSPGQWRGIYLGTGSGASILDNCTFRFSGRDSLSYIRGGWRRPALFVDACNPTIIRSSFLENGGHGVELFASQATLRNNRFENFPDWGYPIVFATVDSFPVLAANTASGTGILGIYVPGLSLAQSGRWSLPGTNLPYLVDGTLTVEASSTLTIDPGSNIRPSASLSILGTLNATGTPDQPITFTGRKADGTPNDWYGIYFGPGAGNSRLRQCKILGAGRENLGYFNGGWRRTAVYIDGSSPNLQNLTVTRSGGHALMISGGNPVLSSSLLSSNAASGIVVFGSAAPQLSNLTLVQNSGSGMEVYDTSAPRLSSSIVAFNSTDGVTFGTGTPAFVKNLFFGNTRSNAYKLPATIADLTDNPRFVDPVNGNFHLASGSPAIDTGEAVTPAPDATDLDGKLRLAGARVDLGAYEFGGAAISHAVDLQIRAESDTAFTGAGQYDPTPQTLTLTTAPGKTASFVARLSYTGNVPEAVTLVASGISDGWTVRLVDVLTGLAYTSGQITGAGITVPNVTPGFTRDLRIEVTPANPAPAATTLTLQLTAAPAGQPTTTDTIQAITRVGSAPSTQQVNVKNLGNGYALLTWNVSGAGSWILESTPALSTPTVWTVVDGTPASSNNQLQVLIPTTERSRFFRLRQP